MTGLNAKPASAALVAGHMSGMIDMPALPPWAGTGAAPGAFCRCIASPKGNLMGRNDNGVGWAANGAGDAIDRTGRPGDPAPPPPGDPSTPQPADPADIPAGDPPQPMPAPSPIPGGG